MLPYQYHQVKSLDWKARNAKHKGNVSQAELETIKQKIGLLMDIS
jgi:mRNA interferase MazF